MTSILVLIVCLVALWYYFSKIREELTRQAYRICRELDLQLLDQTVSLKNIRICTDYGKFPDVCLEYHFEISRDGLDRYDSVAILRKRKIQRIVISFPEGDFITDDSTRDLTIN